jgi:hypothetical protein
MVPALSVTSHSRPVFAKGAAVGLEGLGAAHILHLTEMEHLTWRNCRLIVVVTLVTFDSPWGLYGP